MTSTKISEVPSPSKLGKNKKPLNNDLSFAPQNTQNETTPLIQGKINLNEISAGDLDAEIMDNSNNEVVKFAVEGQQNFANRGSPQFGLSAKTSPTNAENFKPNMESPPQDHLDKKAKNLTSKALGIDWGAISKKLPCSKTDKDEVSLRKKYWRAFDNNGNGYISLSEAEEGIKNVIKLRELYEAKPAIMRAFQFAKNAVPGKSKYGQDYIEKREFRIFLLALRQRFEYYQAFKMLDQSGDGQISIQEFVGAKSVIEQWVGPLRDMDQEFRSIDKNGGGYILFNEFCDWSCKKNLDVEGDQESSKDSIVFEQEKPQIKNKIKQDGLPKDGQIQPDFKKGENQTDIVRSQALSQGIVKSDRNGDDSVEKIEDAHILSVTQIQPPSSKNQKTQNPLDEDFSTKMVMDNPEFENLRNRRLSDLKNNFAKHINTQKVQDYESDTIEIYKMISDEFDYDQIRLGSEHFSIKQYKDSIYRGEIHPKTSKRHGKGVIVYDKGRVYEGEWRKDKRQGRGFELFANGSTYQGEYDGGKANGKGLYTWHNGETYEGQFKGGQKEGKGLWKGVRGDSYLGQWANNKADGYGVHTWVAGDRYEGQWRGCMREGNGTDFFSNGDVYIGEYARGLPEGEGQYKWSNGDTFVGTFMRGMKHGRGKWRQPPPKEEEPQKYNNFQGTYQNDLKEGWGCFVWAMGNKYEGHYHRDERDGWGTMQWIDGSIYTGQWKKGIQQGLGLMTIEGKVRAGWFDNNIFVKPLTSKEELEEWGKELPGNVKQQLEQTPAFDEYLEAREEKISRRKSSPVPQDLIDSDDEAVGQQFKPSILSEPEENKASDNGIKQESLSSSGSLAIQPNPEVFEIKEHPMQQVAEMVKEVGTEVNPNKRNKAHEGLKRVVNVNKAVKGFKDKLKKSKQQENNDILIQSELIEQEPLDKLLKEKQQESQEEQIDSFANNQQQIESNEIDQLPLKKLLTSRKDKSLKEKMQMEAELRDSVGDKSAGLPSYTEGPVKDYIGAFDAPSDENKQFVESLNGESKERSKENTREPNEQTRNLFKIEAISSHPQNDDYKYASIDDRDRANVQTPMLSANDAPVFENADDQYVSQRDLQQQTAGRRSSISQRISKDRGISKEMSQRSRFSQADREIMLQTKQSVRRFKESVGSLQGDKIKEDFNIETDFFSPSKSALPGKPVFVRRKQPHELRTVDVQTDLDMGFLNELQSKMESNRGGANDYGYLSGSQVAEVKHSKKASRPGTIDPNAILESADEDVQRQNTFGKDDLNKDIATERKQMNVTTQGGFGKNFQSLEAQGIKKPNPNRKRTKAEQKIINARNHIKAETASLRGIKGGKSQNKDDQEPQQLSYPVSKEIKELEESLNSSAGFNKKFNALKPKKKKNSPESKLNINNFQVRQTTAMKQYAPITRRTKIASNEREGSNSKSPPKQLAPLPPRQRILLEPKGQRRISPGKSKNVLGTYLRNEKHSYVRQANNSVQPTSSNRNLYLSKERIKTQANDVLETEDTKFLKMPQINLNQAPSAILPKNFGPSFRKLSEEKDQKRMSIVPIPENVSKKAPFGGVLNKIKNIQTSTYSSTRATGIYRVPVLNPIQNSGNNSRHRSVIPSRQHSGSLNETTAALYHQGNQQIRQAGHATSRRRESPQRSPDDYNQFPQIVEMSGREKGSDLDSYGAKLHQEQQDKDEIVINNLIVNSSVQRLDNSSGQLQYAQATKPTKEKQFMIYGGNRSNALKLSPINGNRKRVQISSRLAANASTGFDMLKQAALKYEK